MKPHYLHLRRYYQNVHTPFAPRLCPTGGVTVLILKDDDYVTMAFSICREDENFCKAIGRKQVNIHMGKGDTVERIKRELVDSWPLQHTVEYALKRLARHVSFWFTPVQDHIDYWTTGDCFLAPVPRKKKAKKIA